MISAELIHQARGADLLAYLRMNGYQLVKSGINEYRLQEHDSLVISNNKWHWKSRNIGGNTLDFLVKYEGKSFTESVGILTNTSIHQPERKRDIFITEGSRELKYKGKEKQNKDEPKELNLPEKHTDFRRVFAYLNKTRKIDKGIISDLMKQGLIYESDRHNCVFTGKDNEGIIRFASERGTLTDKVYRKDCSGSDKRFGFRMEGKSDKVYVFEAPIEALSHATIFKMDRKDYKRDHRISLGGVEPLAVLQYLADRPNIKEVVLCLNNDDAGIKASADIARLLEEKGYKVTEDRPILKDYNLDLVEMSKKLEMVMSR